MHPSGKSAFSRTTRLALLVLLAPLFGFALHHAAQYDAKQIYDVAFSADGSKLLVFRQLNVTSSLDPYFDPPSDIQVWEVLTGRLIRTKDIGRGEVSPTLDGRRLFDLNDDGQIRFFDKDSLELLEEWRLPDDLGEVRDAMVHDRLLLATSGPADEKLLTCLHDRRVIRQWSGAEEIRATLSGDGRRLFLSRAGPKEYAWTTHVFEINEDSITELPGESFEGRVIVSSPRGNLALASVGPASLVIRNLETGTQPVWNPRATWGSPWVIFFAGEGEVLRSIYDTGVSAAIVSRSMAVAGEQRLAGVSGPLQIYSVSPDERLFASTMDYRHAIIWDLATGKAIARFPDHRPIRYGLGGSFLAWCLIWVASGLRIKHPRPWLDVAVPYGALLAVVLVHAATRPLWAIHPAIVAISLALLTGLLGMLILWWIHGRLRWSLRLAGMVAGSAAIAGGLLVSGHRSEAGAWNVLLGTIGYIAGLALLLKSWRWRSLSLGGAFETTAVAQDGGRWQAPLKDLLIVITAVSLLLAVLRFSVPSPRNRFDLGYIFSQGIGLAITVFVSIWAAFSPRPFLLRVILAAMTAATVGAAPFLLFRSHGADPLWWCETLHGAAATAVILSLGVFRLHGYRLARTLE